MVGTGRWPARRRAPGCPVGVWSTRLPSAAVGPAAALSPAEGRRGKQPLHSLGASQPRVEEARVSPRARAGSDLAPAAAPRPGRPACSQRPRAEAPRSCWRPPAASLAWGLLPGGAACPRSRPEEPRLVVSQRERAQGREESCARAPRGHTAGGRLVPVATLGAVPERPPRGRAVSGARDQRAVRPSPHQPGCPRPWAGSWRMFSFTRGFNMFRGF